MVLTSEEQLWCPKGSSTDYYSSRPWSQLHRPGMPPGRRASNFDASSEAAVPNNAVDCGIRPQSEHIRSRGRGGQVCRQWSTAFSIAVHVGGVTKRAVLFVRTLVGDNVFPTRGVEASC